MDCIFCKIAKGEVPSDVLHQDDELLVIRDINPQAPTHLLIMPKEHLDSLRDITEANAALISHMVLLANQMAQKEGVAERGYRLAINCGEEGGQSVGHLHLHLLGGHALSGRLG